MAKILVVDDFEDSRFSLCRLLEFSGHTVLEAGDGLEAVRMALAERPGLVLMDLTLPGIDGIEATRRIRAESKADGGGGGASGRIPIVAVTGHDGATYQDRMNEAGCDGYVTKPIDFDELERIIARVLGPAD